MSLIEFLIVMVIVGFVLYLIVRFVPMEPQIKQLMVIGAIVIVLLWILQTTGLLGPIGQIRIGK